MDSRLLKFFGTLKLAVVVLTTLAGVLAVATFYESNTSSRAAALNIYKSWWFNGLLMLLAVNLAAAALLRWPWKRRHVGFVITHAGLIVILGGCSAAFHYGTEGMMDMRVGEPPKNVVRLEDEALTIVIPEAAARTKVVLRTTKSGSMMPHTIPVTKDLAVTLDEYWQNSRVEQTIADGGPDFNPALQFRLQSELAKQDIAQWLLANSPDTSRISIGPASVEFVVARDEDELKRLTTETDSSTAEPALVIRLAGKELKFEIAGSVDKHVDLGDTGVAAHIVGYWPDFRLDENHKPSTASDQPNNPAAVVILSKGENEERYFVFANPQMPPIVRVTKGDRIGAEITLHAPSSAGGAGMTLVLAPDHKSLYYAARSKAGFKSGEMNVGEAVSPGWMDFQVTVEKLVANAIVSERLSRVPEDPEGGFPAVRVTAHAGSEAKSEWVRFGQPSVVPIAGKTVHVVYGWDTMPVPFTVALEDFVVERDEGSQNVASWTSKVVFEDAASGLSQKASIWMNHPAWFNGFKFSQASWNPNDLKYTALQVKKDPRWVTYVTWTGAVLICSGIALMFWGRGWLQRNGKDEGGGMKDERQREEEMVTA